MARRSAKYRTLAFLLTIVPIFTLVVVFGVEWNYVERMSREEVDGDVGERSPRESNRKRAAVNQRSPLDLDYRSRKADSHPDIEVDPPAAIGNDFVHADELERGNDGLLHKQALDDMNRGVLDSLSRQAVNMTHADKANLYKLLKERKLHELRTEKSIREMWWYAREQVALLDQGHKVAEETINGVREQYDILRWNFNNLRSTGVSDSPIQLNWKYWQKRMSLEMTKLMEKRLHYLQNPPDCASAKKLVCQVAKTCGFGCQIHHITYCFIMAYATKRTLIIDARRWRYSTDGWDAVFQPISKTCTTADGEI